jgi:hypothetical protein
MIKLTQISFNSGWRKFAPTPSKKITKIIKKILKKIYFNPLMKIQEKTKQKKKKLYIQQCYENKKQSKKINFFALF